MDVEWYGADGQGNIAVLYNGGEGNLLEFAYENEERTGELIAHFDKFEKITSNVMVLPKTKIGRVEQIARDFFDKGLYYFDAGDGTKLGVCTLHGYYTEHSASQNPLKCELLPKHVREVLKHNLMETEGLSPVDTIHVKYVYIR